MTKHRGAPVPGGKEALPSRWLLLSALSSMSLADATRDRYAKLLEAVERSGAVLDNSDRLELVNVCKAAGLLRPGTLSTPDAGQYSSAETPGAKKAAELLSRYTARAKDGALLLVPPPRRRSL